MYRARLRLAVKASIEVRLNVKLGGLHHGLLAPDREDREQLEPVEGAWGLRRSVDCRSRTTLDFSLMEVGKAARADNKTLSINPHRAADFRSAGSRPTKLCVETEGVVPRDTEAVGRAFTP